jgi:hypothetical protein
MFRDVHQDNFCVDPHRECAEVVGPLVEGAPAGQVETRVMPMAGEDAVLYAAAIEREPHVGASIVHREDSAPGVEERDNVAFQSDDAALARG